MRNLLDQPGIRSTQVVLEAGAWMPRKASDVHLVNNGSRRWSFKRGVAFPIIGGRIHYHAFHGRRAVVSRMTGGFAGIFARDDYTAPIGVEQDLVGIEAHPS